LGEKWAALDGPTKNKVYLGGGVVGLGLILLVMLQETGEINIIPPNEITVGNFIAVDRPMSWQDASHYCNDRGYAGLASIHSGTEQRDAVAICRQMDMRTPLKPRGCWSATQSLSVSQTTCSSW
jgi:hypothetical protein